MLRLIIQALRGIPGLIVPVPRKYARPKDVAKLDEWGPCHKDRTK